MSNFQDLAINILFYFFLIVPSLLQSFIQCFIITSDQNNKIKVSQREKIRTMKIEY
jgi:hypothetical protein